MRFSSFVAEALLRKQWSLRFFYHFMNLLYTLPAAGAIVAGTVLKRQLHRMEKERL